MEIFTVAVAKIMRMARMEPTEFPPPLICLNISVLAKSLPGETRNIMEPKAVMDEVKIWAKLDAKIGADMGRIMVRSTVKRLAPKSFAADSIF